jgi:hypothetical protein
MTAIAVAAATGDLTIFGFNISVQLIIAFIVGIIVGRKWLS